MNGFHLFTTSELKCIISDNTCALEAWLYVNHSVLVTPKDKHLAGLELLKRGEIIRNENFMQ